MKRGLLLRIALAFIAVTGATAALAAKLPTSDLDVQILTVHRTSTSREVIRYPSTTPVIFEKANFVAKMRIVKVLRTDHHLSAGDVIDVQYSITTRTPPHPSFPVRPELTSGTAATISVFGNGQSFEMR